MIFKCPVCKERHVVPNNYDNREYVCLNTANRVSRKTFDDVIPENQLSRSGYNFNKSSTLVDEARPATVFVTGPDYRATGEKIGQLKKNY